MEPIDALLRTINHVQSQIWRGACAYEETVGLDHLAARANNAAEASISSFGQISYASLSAVTNFVNNAVQGSAVFSYAILKLSSTFAFNLVNPNINFGAATTQLGSDILDLGSNLFNGLYHVISHDSHGIKQAYHENDLVLGTEKAVDLLLNIVSLGFAIKGLKPKSTSKIEAIAFQDEISNPTAELITTSDDGYWSMWDDMPSGVFNPFDLLGFNDPSHLPWLRIQSSQPNPHAMMTFLGIIYASSEGE